jgi:hypothetical protein
VAFEDTRPPPRPWSPADADADADGRRSRPLQLRTPRMGSDARGLLDRTAFLLTHAGDAVMTLPRSLVAPSVFEMRDADAAAAAAGSGRVYVRPASGRYLDEWQHLQLQLPAELKLWMLFAFIDAGAVLPYGVERATGYAPPPTPRLPLQLQRWPFKLVLVTDHAIPEPWPEDAAPRHRRAATTLGILYEPRDRDRDRDRDRSNLASPRWLFWSDCDKQLTIKQPHMIAINPLNAGSPRWLQLVYSLIARNDLCVTTNTVAPVPIVEGSHEWERFVNVARLVIDDLRGELTDNATHHWRAPAA